jgi:hypothetical protein
MKLMTLLLGLALVLGLFVVDTHAQTSAPPAPPAQQEGTSQPTPGAADKGAAPPAPTPETRGERPPAAQQAPNVTIDNRSGARAPEGERGRILGVDATVAMVIGAVLIVVIVIALVAMSKRTEDIPTHRSVS